MARPGLFMQFEKCLLWEEKINLGKIQRLSFEMFRQALYTTLDLNISFMHYHDKMLFLGECSGVLCE
jgi:hypothetical protein